MSRISESQAPQLLGAGTLFQSYSEPQPCSAYLSFEFKAPAASAGTRLAIVGVRAERIAGDSKAVRFEFVMIFCLSTL